MNPREIKFYIEDVCIEQNNFVTQYKAKLSNNISTEDDIEICSADSFEELIKYLKYYL